MSEPAAASFAGRVQTGALRVLDALPPRLKRRIAGAPIRREGLELDLNIQVLVKLAEHGPRGGLSGRTPQEARDDLREGSLMVAGPALEGVSTRECTIAGGAGPLRARLFTPRELEPADLGPLIVFFHGGGFVAGDLDTHEQPCRLLARSSGARVLSVDYRLAPEHRFPAASEDALAAFRNAVARAEEFGARPEGIAVAGDSAGGNLAAVTSLLAAADGGPLPSFQLLIYPVTDVGHVSASRVEFADGFLLTKENMDWYEEQYMGPDGDRTDPRASPLLAQDLSGVPPALVVTAGFDPLRDEGEAYARRLIDAGVRTTLRRYPGYVHGFANFMQGAGPGPREALAEMGGVLRAELAG